MELATFLISVTKDIINTTEGRVYVCLQVDAMIHSGEEGRAIERPGSSKREDCCRSDHFPLSLQSGTPQNGPTHIVLGLSTSANPILKFLRRHAHKFVSSVILGPAK